MATQSATSALANRFKPTAYSTNPIELITYEIDAGFDRGRPVGVFFPESTEDVSRMMAWAAETGTALIARGGGTGLAGGVVPEYGGFVLSFSRMSEIGPVDVIGRTVTTQVGAVNLAVDAAVKAHGFYYPPDPSSQRSSVIGGNMGTNAGGPHCFKYGVTTNYVTGIRAVMADGQILRFGGRALDYPEYDFCALLVGSEGTLAVMTEADLRLIPNPGGVKTMMVAFNTLEEAGKAVSAVIVAGLIPATLEMMDQAAMKMITQFAPAGLPVEAAAVLIVEIDGHPEGIDGQMEEVADLLDANGGFDIRIAQSEAERAQIWYGRKSAAGALARLSPRYYLTDVTVPRSHLGEVLAEIERICQRYELESVNVFHAGDGNLHPLILCNEQDAAMMERVHKAGKEIIELCVARGGSISGEHGIGIEKRDYMSVMCSPNELSAMLDIKAIFDPRQLLNPGKIFPAEVPPAEPVAAQMPASQRFAPTSAEEAAAALAALSAAGQKVRIGSGESVTESTADYLLSTHQLNQVIHFAPDDLYVQVGAGMTLAELNQFLQPHQMQTALMASTLDATVGGLLAANVNSPQRIRYGSLRDNLLATTVALADGRVVGAGRPVVKNVAGYDLPKIFVGSYGSLGAMIDVTLKLVATPRASESLRLEMESVDAALQFAQKLTPILLNCAGLVVTPQAGNTVGACRLVCTIEGITDDVAAEVALVKAQIDQAGVEPAKSLAFSSATGEWGGFMADIEPASLIVRVGVPPADLPKYWQMIQSVQTIDEPIPVTDQDGWSPLFDSLSGLIYVKTKVDTVAAANNLLAQLRQPLGQMQGYAVAMRMPDNMATDIEGWGTPPDSLNLMMDLREKWDPAGILVPGGYLARLS